MLHIYPDDSRSVDVSQSGPHAVEGSVCAWAQDTVQPVIRARFRPEAFNAL